MSNFAAQNLKQFTIRILSVVRTLGGAGVSLFFFFVVLQHWGRCMIRVWYLPIWVVGPVVISYLAPVRALSRRPLSKG